MKRLRVDYRHIVCIVITLGFVALGVFEFFGAVGRVIEGGRDIGLSAAYYFCELFQIPHNITPTVNEFPKIPFFDWGGSTPSSPSIPIPDEWQGFTVKWSEYWQVWASGENFFSYLAFLGNLLLILSKVLLLVVSFLLLVYLLCRRILKTQNNDYDRDSVPLRIFKRISSVTYRPAKAWLLSFFVFVRDRGVYWKIWLALWLFYFNAFAIVLEFIAFYLYFVVSFDFANIYRQVYKLILDLWTGLTFFPLWVWLVGAVVALGIAARKKGYKRLRHNERRNRGFLNERGVVTIVGGVMGAGKTAFITDMALSAEVQLRDQAFEIILESDMKFPFFPWCNLENELKRAIEYHAVFSVPSCKAWLKKKLRRWQKTPCREKLFNYDYERYGLTYDDKLKVSDVWQVAEDFACAYFIYTVQSSMLLANYSIRTDNLFSDIGNFPLWNTDFFDRDSRLQDSYSRHAHILDFDMLRLGKILLQNNPNRNAFGFGVYVITEIDKERKNTPELQEVKRNTDECNQKNDLFNVLLKMSRHACVIANRVFVKVVADLQRFGSLGGDVRELGEVVTIEAQSDIVPVLPFYSPFWVFDTLFGWVFNKFANLYVRYRYNRADNSLLLYLLKSITAAMQRHDTGVRNTFGCGVLALTVENGKQDGEQLARKWYKMPKKVYANRYSTDCLSGIFEKRAEQNAVGLDDLPEYVDTRATWEELQMQHSFFQDDLNKVNVQNEQAAEPQPNAIVPTAVPETFSFGYDKSDIIGLQRK